MTGEHPNDQSDDLPDPYVQALMDLALEQTEELFELRSQLEMERRQHAMEAKFGRDFEMSFSTSPDLVGGLSELFELNKEFAKADDEKPTYKTTVFGELDDELQTIDEDFNLNCGGDWCTENSRSTCSAIPIPVLPTLRSSSGPDYSAIVQGTTCTARRNLEHPAVVIGLKH